MLILLHALTALEPRNLRRYPSVPEAENACPECSDYSPVCQCAEFEQAVPEPQPRQRTWDEIEADATGVRMYGPID